jgi:twinkle protein
MSTSLCELLTEAGIRTKSITPGRTEKLICPKCDGGRTREQSLSVTIDADGGGAVWLCHRGGCGWRGSCRAESRPIAPTARAVVAETFSKPVPHRDDSVERPDWLYDFFAARGIGRLTVDRFGVYSIKRRFPEPAGLQPTIVFPYSFKGQLVNRKYRPHPAKNPQLQDPDALPTLFNVDAIETPDVIWWVEGEPDAMALHEVGYRQFVSLKDGAPAELRDENDPQREGDTRFAALATHADLLSEVQKFVLCGDTDGPGLVLREELARRLGRHRCWLVDWPEGCKDAGDVLRQFGSDALREAPLTEYPYPIDGLQHIKPGMLLALRRRPPPPLLTTGTQSTDKILKFPGEGRLIVVTGIPNNGKSTWVTFAMVHLMRAHQRDARDDPPTLEWIIERAEHVVLRDGVTDLVIDPWNEIEHQRGTPSETDYVGRLPSGTGRTSGSWPTRPSSSPPSPANNCSHPDSTTSPAQRTGPTRLIWASPFTRAMA